MYSVKSLDMFEIKGRGTVFAIESPVSADRNQSAMLEAIGPVIEIDGDQYEPKAFEMHMPNAPVIVGEKIGVLV
jgi:hypothetical protein